MEILPEFIQMQALSSRVARGRIVGASEDRLVRVQLDGQGGPIMSADVLCTSDDAPPCLALDDIVLVWRSDVPDSPGVIIGRIGATHAAIAHEPEIPSELVLEATQNLTLKCGEGSITIRADGKILIKGKDLVSNAQRTNRIKGGSVAIN